jgi:outer membrane murein-binding lipoprotein Lpp
MNIIEEQQRDQQSSPAFRTLEQKIDELANDIRGIRDIIWDRKKTIFDRWTK